MVNDYVQKVCNHHLVWHYDLERGRYWSGDDEIAVLPFRHKIDYGWLYKMRTLYGEDEMGNILIEMGNFEVSDKIIGTVKLMLSRKFLSCSLEIRFFDVGKSTYFLLDQLISNSSVALEYGKHHYVLLIEMTDMEISKAFVSIDNFCLEFCTKLFKEVEKHVFDIWS